MIRTDDQPTELFDLPHRGAVIFMAAVIWLGGVTMAAATDARDAHWRCPYTPDGVCVPSRLTFGYSPTAWRRWPEPHPAVKEPEKPAKAETKSAVTEKKKAEKTETAPPDEEEDMVPGQPPPDEPPPTEGPQRPPQEPPQELPQGVPQEPGTPESGAQPPSQGDDPLKIFNESKTPDSSKARPQDGEKTKGDPFSDDKEEPSRDGASSSFRLPQDQASSARWRANTVRRVAGQQETEAPSSRGEPRLFQPAPSSRPIERTSYTTTTSQAKANPLRSLGAGPRWMSSGQTLRTASDK